MRPRSGFVRRGLVAAVAFVALSLGACATGPEEVEKDYSGDVELNSCGFIDGQGRASVTVTNSGEEAAGYVIEVAFTAPGGDRTYGIGRAEVDGTDPGAATEAVAVFEGGVPDMECEVTGVDRSA